MWVGGLLSRFIRIESCKLYKRRYSISRGGWEPTIFLVLKFAGKVLSRRLFVRGRAVAAAWPWRSLGFERPNPEQTQRGLKTPLKLLLNLGFEEQQLEVFQMNWSQWSHKEQSTERSAFDEWCLFLKHYTMPGCSVEMRFWGACIAMSFPSLFTERIHRHMSNMWSEADELTMASVRDLWFIRLDHALHLIVMAHAAIHPWIKGVGTCADLMRGDFAPPPQTICWVKRKKRSAYQWRKGKLADLRVRSI